MRVYRPFFWPCLIGAIFAAAAGNGWLVLGLMYAALGLTINAPEREDSE